MKMSLLFFLLGSSLYCTDLIGTWKLKSEPKKAFNFASIVAYEATFKFNKNGTLWSLNKEGNLLGTERYYKFSGDKLNVYLKNPNQGAVNNFALGIFSSSDYQVQPINSTCNKVIDLKRGSHPFTMCKE
jgi:hypothetical protein